MVPPIMMWHTLVVEDRSWIGADVILLTQAHVYRTVHCPEVDTVHLFGCLAKLRQQTHTGGTPLVTNSNA